MERQDPVVEKGRRSMNTRIHPTLDDLIRLQFGARRFSLLPRQPVLSLLSGRYASRLRGRGLVFEELRDYRPGDDIRSMDWKATARLRRPHVRVYSEERERPVLLVVDQRMSMFFGSARTTKATAAAEAAALVAWRALAVGDRVGAIIFADDDVIEIKPHRSRRNALRICQELVRANAKLVATRAAGDSTTLNEALLRAVNVSKHDHLVFLVTDFADADKKTREQSTLLAAHNDVIAVLVYDPLGAALPVQCSMNATDGKRQFLLPEGSRFEDRFEAAFRERCQQVKEILQALRVPILPICTHDPVGDQIAAALGARP